MVRAGVIFGGAEQGAADAVALAVGGHGDHPQVPLSVGHGVGAEVGDADWREIGGVAPHFDEVTGAELTGVEIGEHVVDGADLVREEHAGVDGEGDHCGGVGWRGAADLGGAFEHDGR